MRRALTATFKLQFSRLEKAFLLVRDRNAVYAARPSTGAAALVFGDIASKVSGAERGHYYRGLLFLSEGYAAWDVADYGVALQKLREAREEMRVEFSEGGLAERAAALVDRISVHLPFLGKVRGRLSLENVVDMLENARRRIGDQGRYDDGVARLYRCVEMWYQWRLGERSISTERVDWEKVEGDVRERFLQETRLNEPPRVLALHHARLLDHIMIGEETEDEAVLKDLLQKRNHSILAHGLKPIEKKSTVRFLEYVDALVEAPEAGIGAEHARLRGL